MASGGASGRGSTSGGRFFDFGSDDVLCSYDDFSSVERSDPSGKDFSENKQGRTLVNVHSHEDFAKEDVIASVEKCMKKYADNLLRFLEGISGRLSQLEVYCYKLERSVGEFRADLIQEQGETDLKFKNLEKHLQEIHRSVQILRDKQELSETQKELAKLQLSERETLISPAEVIVQPVSQPQSLNDTNTDASNNNNHLALALPHQIPTMQTAFPSRAPQQNQASMPPPQQLQPPSLNTQQEHYMAAAQCGEYYPPQTQMSFQPQHQYSQPRRPQVLDFPIQASVPHQTQHQQHQQQPKATQVQLQPPQYQQQQWSQKTTQKFPQQNPADSESQVRPPSYSLYSPETYRISTPTPTPRYAVVPGHPEAVPFGYGGPAASGSQPPPTQVRLGGLPSSFQSSLGQSGNYMGLAPSPLQSYASPPAQPVNVQGYNMAAHHHQTPHNYQKPESYPQGSNLGSYHQGSPQMMAHNNPYGEIIEKAINMGYARDHVLGVIHRMGEAGEPVNLNSLLDRLNSCHSGPLAPKAWSG